MYAIKNLSDLKDKPSTFTEDIFTKFFEIALIANFTDKEKSAYKASLMKMWNNYASFETSFNKGLKAGFEEGRSEVKINVSRKLKESGMSSKDIFKVTKLKEGEY